MKKLLSHCSLTIFNLFQFGILYVFISFILNRTQERLVSLYILFNCQKSLFVDNASFLIKVAALLLTLGLMKVIVVKQRGRA